MSKLTIIGSSLVVIATLGFSGCGSSSVSDVNTSNNTLTIKSIELK